MKEIDNLNGLRTIEPLEADQLLENEVFANQKFAIKGKAIKKVVTCKKFTLNQTKDTILNNVNINVSKGKIYGLLGPSGCGKTTLLKSLIGLTDISEGSVFVDKELRSKYNESHINLNKLGFMPQESSLYCELKINEIFFYFGKLYRLANEEINSKKSFLIDLLNLPIKNQLIGSLSGGQLRRTSFAVALLNNPEILMLDEPTVGVDPILRKKIWDHLIELSEKKMTTIIITTHYIEEAKKAHCLGFMRSGQIIEENSPIFLMRKYQQTNLEDVFYNISLESISNFNHSNNNDNFKSLKYESSNSSEEYNLLSNDHNTVSSQNVFEKVKNSIVNKFEFSIDRLRANLYKDTLKCKRNKQLLLVQFFIPIIQIVFFYLCIGQKPHHLPIGIINNDQSYHVYGLLEYNMGRDLVNAISEPTILKKNFTNYNHAYGELEKGNIWGLLTIDANFTSEMASVMVHKELPDKFTSHLKIYLDNTNVQILYTIKEELFNAVKYVMLKYNSDYKDYELSELPLVFMDPVYGTESPTFTNFMAPGIALSVIFFLSVASTASNYVFERQLGLIERSYLAGVKTIELLLSQLMIYTIIMLIQIVIVMCLLLFVLKLPFAGNLPLLVLLLSSQGFCGLCYGLCLAAMFNDQETVLQVTLASFYPILLMSGMIWPIEAQPLWLADYLSQFLPLTYATEAFRYILEKGWSIDNYFVIRGFVSTYIWTAIFSAMFLCLFSWKTNKIRK